jgi:hypothetical protein
VESVLQAGESGAAFAVFLQEPVWLVCQLPRQGH